MTSPITTHVLDTTRGLPAPGVPVVLEYQLPNFEWDLLARGTTDADGRVRDLLPSGHALVPGRYRLTFETATYFQAIGTPAFYPLVPVVFDLASAGSHYHIPLLLSPYSYATYRGS